MYVCVLLYCKFVFITTHSSDDFWSNCLCQACDRGHRWNDPAAPQDCSLKAKSPWTNNGNLFNKISPNKIASTKHTLIN